MYDIIIYIILHEGIKTSIYLFTVPSYTTQLAQIQIPLLTVNNYHFFQTLSI